jgi:hypothetical protein
MLKRMPKRTKLMSKVMVLTREETFFRYKKAIARIVVKR